MTTAQNVTPEQRIKLRKLVTLANFLDDLPHSRFYLPEWSSGDGDAYSCGTAGCAAGWAGTIFRKEGWSFGWRGCPRFQGSLGESAFAKFFGLSPNDAWDICYSSPYEGVGSGRDITPQRCAKQIRMVVARYDPDLINITDKPEFEVARSQSSLPSVPVESE